MSWHDLFLSPNGAADAGAEADNVTSPTASKIGSNFGIRFLPPKLARNRIELPPSRPKPRDGRRRTIGGAFLVIASRS